MKKIMICFFILMCCIGAYSQECIGEMIAKQAGEIIDLKNKLSKASDIAQKCIEENSNLKIQITKFQEDTEEINKIKMEKIIIDNQLKEKADSIGFLNNEISKKDSIIEDCKREGIKKAQNQYNQGQQKMIDQIAQTYEESFDELIIISTPLSIDRDMRLLYGKKDKAYQKLMDLQKFYAAQNVLALKFNAQNIQNAQSQLQAIQQDSEFLAKLKSNIEDYYICNEGLKTAIRKIIDIDEKETAVNDTTQNLKRTKILSELTSYIFNYNYNLNDYPYLSDVVLEIIKLKQPDANANISDLLNKL